MKRIKLLGVALMAVFVLSVIAATTASAEEQQKSYPNQPQ